MSYYQQSRYKASVKVQVNGEIKTITVSKEYHTKEAVTKAGERLLADVKEAGMTPIGSFIIRSPSGKEVRPILPREVYRNLFYWIPIETMQKWEMDYRADPGDERRFGQRKYDTLDQARKGALNQSKKRWNEIHNGYNFYNYSNISIAVYQGPKYLGFVTYNILKGKKDMFKDYEGTWSPAGHEKDEQLLKKDGTLL